MMPYRENDIVLESADQRLARSHIERETVGDEQALWLGRAKKGIILSKADIPVTIFMIFWAGFAVFWEVTAIISGAPFFFCLFGLPFVAIGLYMLIGRHFWDSYQRGRTFYAITNRRVLVVVAGSTRRVTSYELLSLLETSIEERGDGSGNLLLGPDPNAGTSRNEVRQQRVLRGVLDAREAYATLRSAQDAAREQFAPRML